MEDRLSPGAENGRRTYTLSMPWSYLPIQHLSLRTLAEPKTATREEILPALIRYSERRWKMNKSRGVKERRKGEEGNKCSINWKKKIGQDGEKGTFMARFPNVFHRAVFHLC